MRLNEIRILASTIAIKGFQTKSIEVFNKEKKLKIQNNLITDTQKPPIQFDEYGIRGIDIEIEIDIDYDS